MLARLKAVEDIGNKERGRNSRWKVDQEMIAMLQGHAPGSAYVGFEGDPA